MYLFNFYSEQLNVMRFFSLFIVSLCENKIFIIISYLIRL